jgi:pSer/pThr/pTyr-binding forkhead associated (FHA) protein
MPVITVNDQQYALRPGQNRLGAGSGADVRVDGDGTAGVVAIIDVGTSAHPVIHRIANGTSVRVNGVPLTDPTPLIHGDKVDVGGSELLYSDDAQTGATRFVSLSEIAAIAADRPAAPGAKGGAANSGGRLVSLVDGKEYQVADGVTIGRDAGCAIVVAQNEVSRRHASIAPTDGGYELRDLSANGVFVNGARIDKSHLLSRSDLIQIGSEEFRFHADSRPTVVSRPQLNPTTSMPAYSPAVAQRTASSAPVSVWVWGLAAIALAAVGGVFLLNR